jgi:hypothetical protein
MSEKWVSIVEYARHYNISDMTVRRRIKTGKLKSVLKEGKYYVQLSSLAPNSPPGQPVSVPQAANPNWQTPYPSSPPPSPPLVPAAAPTSPFTSAPGPAVDSKLVTFCELALKKLSDSEKWLEEKYKSQFESLKKEIDLLQEKLNTKHNTEIELKQKIEDLQTLLQLIEQKY